jgi:hypothetical protein
VRAFLARSGELLERLTADGAEENSSRTKKPGRWKKSGR